MVHATLETKSAITLLAFGAYNTPAEKNGATGRTIRENREHPASNSGEARPSAGAAGTAASSTRRVRAEIGKQNDGIRSLIVVARTCLDSIKEMRERHDADYRKLLESQAITDEKLHILIDTVDRVIRRESKSQ